MSVDYSPEFLGNPEEHRKTLQLYRECNKRANWAEVALADMTKERDEARAELEKIKAILADPAAVHINLLRGTIVKPNGWKEYHEWQPIEAELAALKEANRWIPVAERLPKKQGCVEVVISTRNAYPQNRRPDEVRIHVYGDKHFWGLRDEEEVTHWRPLPEAPKEVSN